MSGRLPLPLQTCELCLSSLDATIDRLASGPKQNAFSTVNRSNMREYSVKTYITRFCEKRSRSRRITADVWREGVFLEDFPGFWEQMASVARATSAIGRRLVVYSSPPEWMAGGGPYPSRIRFQARRKWGGTTLKRRIAALPDATAADGLMMGTPAA